MSKRRIKVAVKTATLTVGDAEITVRTNAPASALADVNSGDFDRVLAGLDRIILDHPWVDEADRPLPTRDLDPETLAAVVTAYGEHLQAPKV